MSPSDDDDDEDPKLPHDVAVEVLKRLPAGSLLRCRCVCRSWRSAIDDPRFVGLHLTHSAQDASSWHLVSLDWYHRLYSLFPDEHLTLPSQSQIQIPFAAPPIGHGIVGSCNGLICVAETSENGYGRWMYLWNVFTRKHKAVRRTGPGHQFFPLGTAYEVLGFGFDARSPDYTIVRILYFIDDNCRCFDGRKPRVEIYSLSTDSWRSLECEVPAFCVNRRAAFLNGNLHWPSFKHDDGGYRSIVSFDVAGEVFDEMALLEEIFHSANGILALSLAVLHDLLAVFINITDAVGHPEPHSICSVWVMREYGMPESWTKLYTFEACGLVTRFDGFTRNGELLMDIDDEEIVSWEPITGQYMNLQLSTHYNLVTVMESLVSPQR